MTLTKLPDSADLVGRIWGEPEVRRLLLQRYDGMKIMFVREDEPITADVDLKRVRVIYARGPGKIISIEAGG